MSASPSQPVTILKITTSAQYEGSISRALSERMVASLLKYHPNANVVVRDVAAGLPFIDEHWVGANFTPEEARNQRQREILALSDTLIAELKAADFVVIGLPVYNFGVPATLKAWVDLVCRARVTFRYTENGPVGLLTGKRAFIAMASSGVRLDSEVDFVGRYMRQMLKFVGIEAVTWIKGDALKIDGEAKIEAARQQIRQAAAQTAGLQPAVAV